MRVLFANNFGGYSAGVEQVISNTAKHRTAARTLDVIHGAATGSLSRTEADHVDHVGGGMAQRATPPPMCWQV